MPALVPAIKVVGALLAHHTNSRQMVVGPRHQHGAGRGARSCGMDLSVSRSSRVRHSQSVNSMPSLAMRSMLGVRISEPKQPMSE
jgi:hypothetical protein